MATKKDTEIINIMPVELETVLVKIRGMSPLITHAWSAKARREMLEKQMNVTKTKARDVKNPWADFASSMYWLTPMPEELNEETITEAISNGARFGFPTTGIKQAACAAVYRAGIVKNQMGMRGAFFIEPTQNSYYSGEVDINSKTLQILPNRKQAMSMTEIICPEGPVMREDNVKVGMGAADIRYRAQFTDWEMNLQIKYNRNGPVSPEQIINSINLGGFSVGIGEWRPEKDGQNGMFEVVAC